MYSDYKIALPDAKQIDKPQMERTQFNHQRVTMFVNSIKKRPVWYVHVNNDPKYDTKAYVLNNSSYFKSDRKNSKDPFTGKIRFEWLCANCKCGVTYAGVDLGHINNWRDELVNAGVTDSKQAQAVFNNLLNLQIECATCNRSHDWE